MAPSWFKFLNCAYSTLVANREDFGASSLSAMEIANCNSGKNMSENPAELFIEVLLDGGSDAELDELTPQEIKDYEKKRQQPNPVKFKTWLPNIALTIKKQSPIVLPRA